MIETHFFTFGQSHRHRCDDLTLDKDCVVSIASTQPRLVMMRLFNRRWCGEHDTLEAVHMALYPRGVIPVWTPLHEAHRLIIHERELLLTQAQAYNQQILEAQSKKIACDVMLGTRANLRAIAKSLGDLAEHFPPPPKTWDLTDLT